MKKTSTRPTHLADSSPPAQSTTPSDSLYSLVASHPFLHGLAESHLKILTGVAMATSFAPGQYLYRQGEAANRFYLILDGRAELRSEPEIPGANPIRIAESGADLGWAWLFGPSFFPFTARAITATRALFFYGTRLRQQCEEDHPLGYEMMKRVARVMYQDLTAHHQNHLATSHSSVIAALTSAKPLDSFTHHPPQL